jgi:hypothetical protein
MSVSVAVITCGPSDLLALLQKSPALTVEVLHPNALTPHCLDGFQCACVLGGTREEPLVFPAECRSVVEDFSHSGRRVLYEYTLSFCQNYCASPDSTRFLRLVCTDAEFAGLEDGLLLDDQCNMRCTPYYRNNLARPILMYKKGLSEHARQPLSQQERTDCQQYGIWLETPAVAVCSFRLCNFLRARFSPVPAWSRLVRSLIGWLCGAPVLEKVEFPPQYQTGFARSAADCAASGIDWFSRSGILVDEGKRGVLEGLGTEIYPDGHQKTASSIRTDCCGEAALAYLMHFLAFGDARSLERAQNLEAFVYDKMQIRSGRFQGMLRWTDIAWEVCYQDDMARAMLVTLFKALYGLGREYLPQCRMALEFLMNTTGPDGLRPARTDNLNMSEEDFAALSRQNGAFPCAHYNAFYLACLLLYGKLEKDARCLAVGETGMQALLQAYPKTIREQSQTEELCRLLLPFAWLYYATGKQEYRQMLYTVTRDLEKMRHPSGAYLEWDDDYSAACSKQENGECSLLARNGDPVCDLLYSNNWVPLGLMQAYFVTEDAYFYDLFCRHAAFLSTAQIHSQDPRIDGAWARGFDAEQMEVCGLPNDVGWGPWAVESGWTVAEICAGLLQGVLKDKLKEFYK